MKLKLELNRRFYEVDFAHPLDLSIPISFSGPQASAFGAGNAKSRPLESGNFIGDTRKGGSCNCETIEFTPHCNGTHTEGVGHITDQRIPLPSLLSGLLIPASLITIKPQAAHETDDRYIPRKNPEDFLITSSEIDRATENMPIEFAKALIVRTLPNDSSKLARNYSDKPAPYFSLEAIEAMVDVGVEHLICDLPSVDRAADDGKLMVHRTFWGIAEGQKTVGDIPPHKTITELAYIPSFIPDGPYLLNLIPMSFVADAVPSRPILYSIKVVQ